jgi:hypothetical protein
MIFQLVLLIKERSVLSLLPLCTWFRKIVMFLLYKYGPAPNPLGTDIRAVGELSSAIKGPSPFK